MDVVLDELPQLGFAFHIEVAAHPGEPVRPMAGPFERIQFNLPAIKQEASAEQVVLLQRKRGDAENVFDEVKNQWGFRGFCSRREVVTEVAARLVWLTYNLWTLFVRLMGLEPGQHTEAVRSRWQFLVLAAQMSWSGRQRRWKLAVTPKWWRELKGCYERLGQWLKATAPQLESQRQFLRLLAFETPVDPGEWFGQTVLCPSG